MLQVLGGYLSDRLGGQRVILTAAVGWSIITLWMPQLIWFINDPYLSVYFIVAIRVANGAFQVFLNHILNLNYNYMISQN